MNDDTISRKSVIDAVHTAMYGFICGADDDEMTDVEELVLSINKAVCNAIKALPSAQPETEERTAESAQNVPNDELISKKAAIDAVQNAFDKETILNSFVRKVAIDALKALSSVQPQSKREWYQKGYEAGQKSVQPQRWIPVTEALPEHSGFYIVTAIVTDDGGKLVGLRWFSQEHGWKFGKNPLAWMPLPEPWKGEKHEL